MLVKEPAVLATLEHLKRLFGYTAFVVVDLWYADLHAIGIARANRDGYLLYFTTRSQAPGRYDVALELPVPAGSELPYASGGWHHGVDFSTLATLVATHLGLTSRSPSARPAE